MGLRRLLPTALGGAARRHYECRRCGETLDGADDACQYCEDSAVATYDLRA